jgi:cation diffusion facilitator CzcD-associated flavoprotein CzcO
MQSNPQHEFHPVLVIGAGVCGLAVACRLKRRGVPVVIIDQAERVAEPWRRRHPQLRMNTHRALSSLPGLALPRSDGVFASRDTVIAYLSEYVRRACLGIEYRVTAERIDPIEGGWRLQTSAGTRRARHVVVATGRERLPIVPRWPGIEEFSGHLIHAAEFGRADAYRDRRVLVVGAGNSGVDVLNHLVRVQTRQLWVSVRHGSAVVPIFFGGFPVHRFAALMGRLPLRAVDALLAITERMAFGDLRKYGMPRYADGAATRLVRDGVAPAADDGFVAALKAGRVVPVPAVQHFDGASIVLCDGNVLQPDVVICATGYRPGLEPLLGHLGVLDANGLPRPLGDDAYRATPGLWLIGMWPRLEGNFYAANVESRRIANEIFRSLEQSQERGSNPSASEELRKRGSVREHAAGSRNASRSAVRRNRRS